MKIELTPKQTQFVDAVFSGDFLYACFGGGIRGGKSFVVICILMMLSKMYPGSRWAIVRKDLPTLRRNTIPTFDRIAHPFFGPINRSEWKATAANGSEILFFPESLKDDPDLNRWKGLEISGLVLEEANEMSEASFNKSIERAGSWKIEGRAIDDQPAPLVLLTCNPANGWVKRIFYGPHATNTLKRPFYFLQSLVTDNPHISPEYLKSLENLNKTDPIAYARFVKGDWTVSDDPLQLVKYEWLLAAKDVEPIAGKSGMGVDVARYGDDDSVLCMTEGNRVLFLEYHHGFSLDHIADLVQAKICNGPIDSERVCLDVCGIGAGVYDILQKAGYRVTPIDSGRKAEGDESEKPVEQRKTAFTFKNRRSQLWWLAREKLRLGEVCLEAQDSRLTEDLTAVRYSINGDKMIQVESKDDIKKRLGRSTDAGDAFVYALAQPQELAYSYETSTAVRRAPVGTISTELDDDKSPHPHMFTGGGLFGASKRRC